MNTERLTEFDIDRAASILKEGGLVGIPTETVYGLGANGLDPVAVTRIFEAKGRPQDNPLILHISSADWLQRYCVEIPDTAYELAKQFWPGPMTMILKRGGMVPDVVTAGLDTVGMRCPGHSICREIIAKADIPVAAPSGNTSGRPSPTTAEHMLEDMDGKINAIVDGGACAVGVESTIIDLTCTPPRLLRPGGITLEQLESVLGNVEVDAAVRRKMGEGEQPRAPGMKYRHYAPKAPVIVVKGEPNRTAQYIAANAAKGSGVICFDEFAHLFPEQVVTKLGSANDPAEQARHVFDDLRFYDDTDVAEIWAQCPEETGVGLAVANRLNKAAGFHIIEVKPGTVILPILVEQKEQEPLEQFLDRAAEQIKPNARTFEDVLVWLKEEYGAEEYAPAVSERDQVRANILLNRPDLSEGMPDDYRELRNWLADKPEVAGLDVRGYRLSNGVELLLEMSTEGGQSSCKGAGEVFDEMALFRGVTEADIQERTRRFVNYALLLKKRDMLK